MNSEHSISQPTFISTKPPIEPKASRILGSERQKQLKDRLKLSWSSGNKLASNIGTSNSLKGAIQNGEYQEMTNVIPGRATAYSTMNQVKGFGEKHFTDSVILEGDHLTAGGLNDGSSIWTDVAPRQPYDQSMISKKIAGERTAPPQLTVSFYSTKQQQQENGSKRLQPTESSVKISTRSHGYKSKLQSHLNLSQTLQEEGMESVVESLVYGDAGFCYLQREENDFYQFGIKDNYPQSILTNEFTTMSAHGIVRANGADNELVDFQTLAREKVIYAQLQQIRLFRTYSSWKMFYVWKHNVHRRRYMRRSQELAKNLMLGDEFCRNLLMKCRIQFENLREIQVLALDLTRVQPFEEFLMQQRERNIELKGKFVVFLQEIVEILCSKCEDYVLEAAESAPASVSNQVYNSMKLLNSHDHGAILRVAKEAKDIVRDGTKFDPTEQITASMTRSIELTASVLNNNPLHDFGLKDNNHSFTAPPPGLNGRSTTAGRDMVSIPYTIRAAMRLKCRKLVALFRLTDFMIRDAYYDLIQMVLMDLQTLMIRANEQFRGPTNFGLDSKDEVHEPGEEHGQDDADAFERERLMRRVGNKSHNKKLVNNFSSQKINHGLFLVKMVLLSHIPKWQSLQQYQQELPSLQLSRDNQEPEFSDSDEEEEENMKTKGNSAMPDVIQSARSRFDFKKVLGGKYFVVQTEDFVTSATIASSLYDSTFISNNVRNTKMEDMIIISNQTMISLNPGRIYCLEQFEQVLKETALICSYVEGLFFQPRCQNIFTPVKGELALSFNNVLEDRIFLDSEQNRIPSLLRNVISQMNDEFQFIQQQEIIKLNFLRLNYHDQLKIHGTALRRRLQDHSAEQIMEELTVWDRQLVVAEKLVHTYDYGILRIDLLPSRSVFLSALKMNHELYSKLIPELYVKHGDSFFNEISTCIDRITAKFTSLEDFIKVVEAYHHALNIMNQVDVRFTYIMHLRDIIEARGVKISDAILRQNLTLNTTYNKFQLIVHEFEDILEAQIKIYRAEMMNRLKVIMVPIDDLKEFLTVTNTQMLQENFEPNIEDLLKRLDHYRKEIEQVTNKLRTLDYYQTILNIVIFEKGLELEVMESLHANLLLWRSWKTVRDLTDEFLRNNFLDANCERVQKDVGLVKTDLTKHSFFIQLEEEISSQSTKVVSKTDNVKSPSKSLNAPNGSHVQHDSGNIKGIHNAYVKILQLSTKVLSFVPIIQCLQSKTLKATHMRNINRLLKRNIYGLFDLQPGNHGEESVDSKIVEVHDDMTGYESLVEASIYPVPLSEIDSSDITVGELVESVRILDFATELEKIYEESRMQYNLECKYNELVKLCESFEFIFDQDQENKSFVYISNFHSIIENLEDMMIDLRAIRGSKYSDMFLSRINQTIANFGDCLQMIHTLSSFQKQYFKQRLLFGSARVARSLSSCVKQFKGLDEIWRFLIKSTKSAGKVMTWYYNADIRVVTIEKFQVAKEYIQMIQKTYDDVVIDHCEKYPRFYCLDHSMLQDLLILPDLKQLFLVAAQYMFGFIVNDLEIESPTAPTLTTANSNNSASHAPSQQGGTTKLGFGEGTSFSGIVSFEEKLLFGKPCMGRSNIVEWFKSMELAIQDRVEKDIKELIVEHVAHPLIENFPDIFRYSEQSLILSYQVKFWERLRLIFNASGHNHDTSAATIVTKRYFGTTIAQLRTFHAELIDQINMITSLLADSVAAHQTKIVSNMLILMIYCRDLLKSIVDGATNVSGTTDGSYFDENDQSNDLGQRDFQPFQDSVLFFAMEKFYDKASHHVFVKQGGLVDRYGMKYQGFNSRLVILPIVEKCFFALNQSFRHSEFPVLTNNGPDAIPPRCMVQQLHYEMGTECLVSTYLHGKQSFETNFTRLVQASIKSGIFVLLDIPNTMADDKLTSFITNTLSVLVHGLEISKSALVSNVGHHPIQQHAPHGSIDSSKINNHLEDHMPITWTVGSQERIIADVVDTFHKPRFAFMFRDNTFSERYALGRERFSSSIVYSTVPSVDAVIGPKIGHELRDDICQQQQLNYVGHLFRPLSVPSISFNILLTVLLSAHNFAFVHKIAERLEQMAHFFLHNRLLPVEIVKSLLFHCVKFIGVENEHSSVNVAMQLGMISRKLFSFLPTIYLENFTDADLRLFCNLFLEIVYNPITDKKDFQPLISPPKYEDHLYQLLCPSILQYGSANGTILAQYQMAKSNASALMQMNKKRAILVVGPTNVGKTLMIKKMLHSLQSDQIKLKQDITAGRIAHYQEQYQIVLHQPSINFELFLDGLMMDNISALWNESLSIDSNEKDGAPISSDISLNPILAYFEKECLFYSQNISTQENGGGINSNSDHSTLGGMSLEDSRSTMHYYHVDFSSSLLVSYFLPPLMDFLQKYFPFHNLTFVCELVELKHIDPKFLVFHAPLLHISERSYDLEAVIDLHFQECIHGESFSFQKLMKELKELYIRPCIANIPTDSIQSHFTIAKNLFKLISAMFQAYVFPCYKGKVESFHHSENSAGSLSQANKVQSENRALIASFQPFDEDSLRRIVLFSCIWTVGMCSPSSRNSFEDWFKSHFALLAEETNTSLSQAISGQSKFSNRIFPIADESSIYDFVLIRQSGSIGTLQWVDSISNKNNNSTTHPQESKPNMMNLSEYQRNDCQIELLTSLSFSNIRASLMIPTRDTMGLSIIQSALSGTLPFANRHPTCLLLAGEPGTGKTMLFHQLLRLASNPSDTTTQNIAKWDTCSRWICHFKETEKHIEGMQRYILSSKFHALSGLYEQSVGRRGALFIEDLNIDQYPEKSSGSYHTLKAATLVKHLMEHEHLFDAAKMKWRKMPLIYCVLAGDIEAKLNSKNGEANGDELLSPSRSSDHRLLHHPFLHFTSSSAMKSVFVSYLSEPNSAISSDIVGDLIQYTTNFFEVLQIAIQARCSTFNWISNAKSTFQNTEKVMLLSLKSAPVLLWSKWLLSQLSTTLNSMSAVTVSDVIRVLDRLLADLTNRFASSPVFVDVFNEAHEIVLNNVTFSHPSFLGMLEKERSIRLSNIEGILYGMSPPLPNEGVSYSRGCGGFFRSGSLDVVPTVWTGEFTREVILKKLHSFFNADSTEGMQAAPFAALTSESLSSKVRVRVHHDDHRFALLASYFKLTREQDIQFKKECLFFTKNFKNSIGFWNDVTLISSIWTCASFNNLAPKSSLILMLDGENGNNDSRHMDYGHRFSSIKARVQVACQMLPSCTCKIIELEDTKDSTTEPLNNMNESRNDLFEELLFHMLMDHDVLLSLKRYLYIRKYGASAADVSRSSSGKQYISLISPEVSSQLRNILPQRYSLLLELVELAFQHIDVHKLLNEERQGHQPSTYVSAARNNRKISNRSGSEHFKWTCWLMLDSSGIVDLSQPDRLRNKLCDAVEIIQSFGEKALNFLSILLKSDNSKSIDVRHSESIRNSLDGFFCRQHFVFAVNSEQMIPVEKLNDVFAAVQRSNFEILHVLNPYQDYCEEDTRKRFSELVSYLVPVNPIPDKHAPPDELATNSKKLSDLHWQKDELWGTSSKLFEILTSFAVCSTHLLKRIRNDCYLFVHPHTVQLMKNLHSSIYMEFLYFVLNYIASSSPLSLHKRAGGHNAVSLFLRDTKAFHSLMEIMDPVAKKGGLIYLNSSVSRNDHSATELKGIVLSILLLSTRMMSASHVIDHFNTPFPSSLSSLACRTRRVGEKDKDTKGSEEEGVSSETSLLSIIESELLNNALIHSGDHQEGSNNSILLLATLNEKNFFDIFHSLSFSSILAFIRVVITSALNGVNETALSDAEHRLYNSTIQTCLTTMRLFLENIVKLYLCLPSSSSLKSWLVSFLFAAFTHKHVRIVDFSMVGLTVLSELLGLQLDRHLADFSIEEGKISYLIHCEKLFDLEVASIQKYLFQGMPWFFSSYANQECCTFTILPNDGQFIADLYGTFILSRFNSCTNPHKRPIATFQKTMMMSSLRDIWFKRCEMATVIWKKFQNILFANISDSTENSISQPAPVLSNDDDEYNRVWSEAMEPLVQVMDGLSTCFHSIMSVKFNVLQQGNSSSSSELDPMEIKKFILCSQKQLLSISIEEMSRCEFLGVCIEEKDGDEELKDNIESEKNKSLDSGNEDAEDIPRSFSTLFAIVCKKFVIQYLPSILSVGRDSSNGNIEESAYLQCLWNIVLDLFFSIGSNPFHLQQYYSATHHMGVSHHFGQNVHQSQQVGHQVNISCRVKFLTALRYLSITENISKSTKIFMKYGLLRREKQSSTATSGTLTSNTFNEEEEDDEQDSDNQEEKLVEEDIILSDTARAVLKNCFQISAQFMTHVEQHHGQYQTESHGMGPRGECLGHSSFFQRHYSAIMNHPYNKHLVNWSNASWIIGSIDKNVDDWVDWIADPSLSCHDLPLNDEDQVVNFLDQIMIAVILKPLLLPGLLLKIICNIGFSVYEKIDRTDSPMNAFASTSVLINGTEPIDFVCSNTDVDNQVESIEIIQSPEVLYFNRNKMDRYLEFKYLKSSSTADVEDSEEGEDAEEGTDKSENKKDHELVERILVRKGFFPVHHIVIPASNVKNAILLQKYLEMLEDTFKGHLYGSTSTSVAGKDDQQESIVRPTIGNLVLTIESDQLDQSTYLEVDIGVLNEIQRRRGFASLTIISNRKLLIKQTLVKEMFSLSNSANQGSDMITTQRIKFSSPPYDTLTGLPWTEQPPTPFYNSMTLCHASNQPGSEILNRMNELLVFLDDNFAMDHSINISLEQVVAHSHLGTVPIEYEELINKFADRLQWLMMIFHVSVEYQCKVIRWKTTNREMGGTEMSLWSKAFSLSSTLLLACNSVFAMFKQRILMTIHELTVITHPDGSTGPKIEKPSVQRVMDLVLNLHCSERIVRYIALDTIYLSCITSYLTLSPLDIQQIGNIFEAIFAPGSLSSIQSSSNYMLFNRLTLPRNRNEMDQFMQSTRDQLCEGEISPQDETIIENTEAISIHKEDDDDEKHKDSEDDKSEVMSRIINPITHGSGYGEGFFELLGQAPVHHHQHVIYLVEDAIIRNSQVMLALHDKFHNHTANNPGHASTAGNTASNTEKIPVPSLYTSGPHSLRNIYDAPSNPAFLVQVKALLTSWLAALPDKIRLDQASSAIQQQMEAHMIGEDGQIARNKTSTSSSTTTTSKAALNPMPPMAHRGSALAGATKRRAGQRVIIRFQSREYEPVWAYLLMEVLQFNKALQSVKNTLSEMLHYNFNDWLVYVHSAMMPKPLSSFQYHEQRSSVQSKLANLFMKLLTGFLPAQWCGYRDSFFSALQFIKVDSWLGLLQEKRKMLMDWLEIGDPVPATAKFYLLDDPRGLLFALKESFAFHMDTSVDKVRLHFECLPLTSIPLTPPSSTSSALNAAGGGNTRSSRVVNPTVSTTSATGTTFYNSINPIVHNSCAGCHVYFANVNLNNGLFSTRTNMLELLPDYHCSSFGSEIVVHIYASLEEPVVDNEEMYVCPIYIPSNDIMPNFILRTTIGSSLTQPFSSQSTVDEREAFCYVPINTTEDIDDCVAHRVALYSAPAWIVPV